MTKRSQAEFGRGLSTRSVQRAEGYGTTPKYLYIEKHLSKFERTIKGYYLYNFIRKLFGQKNVIIGKREKRKRNGTHQFERWINFFTKVQCYHQSLDHVRLLFLQYNKFSGERRGEPVQKEAVFAQRKPH